jgi:membrane fusion protein (multidrug efflux system)
VNLPSTTTQATDPGEAKPARELTAPRLVPVEGRVSAAPQSARSLAGWGLALLLLAALFLAGYVPKQAQRARLAADAAEQTARPSRVAVIRPKPSRSDRDLALTGNLAGSEETTVYARADGFVKRWLVDMGDRVKAQQLLAELDTPELDQEIEQASAELARSEALVLQARAALDYANSTLERHRSLSARGFTSKQDLAQNEAQFGVGDANLKVAEAGRTSALANLHRLQQLKSFARVLAPFAGTITSRLVERGSLVAAGTASPLFAIVTVDPLRVVVNVPQSLVTGVQQGLKAQVEVAEYPRRSFEAAVTRTSGSLDAETRTMSVELRVLNGERLLLPGMYATVRLSLPSSHEVLVVPATALIPTNQGLRVARVDATGKVSLVPVVVERDNGNEVELASGLTAQDRLISNPAPTVFDGLQIEPTEE